MGKKKKKRAPCLFFPATGGNSGISHTRSWAETGAFVKATFSTPPPSRFSRVMLRSCILRASPLMFLLCPQLYFIIISLVTPRHMWDLSSLTRDWTSAPPLPPHWERRVWNFCSLRDQGPDGASCFSGSGSPVPSLSPHPQNRISLHSVPTTSLCHKHPNGGQRKSQQVGANSSWRLWPPRFLLSTQSFTIH